jgi:agmatine/peptidylarginine deiminase
MTRSRIPPLPCFFGCALLCVLLLSSALSLGAQTPQATSQHTANDVVILSLEALNPAAELRRHVREGVMGDPDGKHNVDKLLLDIQMNIVRDTSKFGPVLLLAPDDATKNAVQQRCKEFGICELLESGRVRMKVVAHDGVWVRDFGPQIEADGDSAHVAHWRYFDIRTEQAKQEKFQDLETARLKLLEAREREEQPDALAQESSPEARKAVAATIDDKLYLLKEYSEILKEADPQRTNDENSAYDIADAVLASPDFQYQRSTVALDGGNLFKLDDGRCLTTRVLLTRNKDTNVDVDEALKGIARCKQVTYLEPLPGPVIEHVDLFVLPAGGKRILLASYDLTKPFAKEYWGKLSGAERELAMNAEVEMEKNAEQLRRLGYEVLLVPSPFPKIPANGHTYYPSVLNALVREGVDGEKQILVPSYKDYEQDIQAAAVKEIGDAFGPKAEIVTIEATPAAESQGAIHCLTLAAPLKLSIFGDAAETARENELRARKEELDKTAGAEIAAQIPPDGLQGAWAILEENERWDQSPLELYPQRIFFTANEFQRGVYGQLEAKGKYGVDRKDGASWSLHFEFADRSATPAVAQWSGKDQVKLILGDGGKTLVLRRIGSEQKSPFEPTGQSPPQTGHKSKNSTGQVSGTLEPVQ